MQIDWRPGLLVQKDPDSVISDQWSFADWLDAGEVIASASVSVPSGITKDADTHDDSTVTVTLSGGTVGQRYTVTVQPTTSAGRVDDFSVVYFVEPK